MVIGGAFHVNIIIDWVLIISFTFRFTEDIKRSVGPIIGNEEVRNNLSNPIESNDDYQKTDENNFSNNLYDVKLSHELEQRQPEPCYQIERETTNQNNFMETTLAEPTPPGVR